MWGGGGGVGGGGGGGGGGGCGAEFQSFFFETNVNDFQFQKVWQEGFLFLCVFVHAYATQR